MAITFEITEDGERIAVAETEEDFQAIDGPPPRSQLERSDSRADPGEAPRGRGPDVHSRQD
jgi:hypothetical protein